MNRESRYKGNLRVATVVVAVTVLGLASGVAWAAAGDQPTAAQLPKLMDRDVEIALALSPWKQADSSGDQTVPIGEIGKNSVCAITV